MRYKDETNSSPWSLINTLGLNNPQVRRDERNFMSCESRFLNLLVYVQLHFDWERTYFIQLHLVPKWPFPSLLSSSTPKRRTVRPKLSHKYARKSVDNFLRGRVA